MKKLNVIIVFSVFLLTAFIGCASTSVKGSGLKAPKPKMTKASVQIIDYQGAALGSEIPEWVVKISEGEYSNEALSKVMPDLKGKKVFVTIASGDNLKFVRDWTDLVDVEVQVGDTMQRVVGKVVTASEKATAKQEGKEADPTKLEQDLNMYKQAVSAVELNGLQKTSSYWIEKRVGTDKSYKDSYEYYAVWTMDEALFNQQLESAMKTVKDNTSEGETLKTALAERLTGLIISSNDESRE